MSAYFLAENSMAEYDVISVEQHKYLHTSHNGKGRSKREATCNANRPDPGGYTPEAAQKPVNNSWKRRASNQL